MRARAAHGPIPGTMVGRRYWKIWSLFVAKHRRRTTSTSRRIATTAAVAATATVAVPGVANAATVVVPNTGITFEVAGLENIPGIHEVPNIGAYVPQLSAGAPVAPAPVFAGLPAAPTANSTGERVVAAVRSAVGSPYGWGSAGPSSFDCSGLTSWAYAQAGKQIPRTSQAQAAAGTPVAISDLQPGDIVAYYGGASHVGIYIGNGKIIDSLNQGTTVQERSLHYMPIHSAVRF